MSVVGQSGKLAVFTKSVDSKHVKTRIADDLGNDVARLVHTTLVQRTIHSASRFNPVIYFTGPLGDSGWTHGFNVVEQRGTDLGKRMLACFEDGIHVIIGTDCPLMSERYIQTAFDALRSNDLVLGPTEDGGYVLIGMKRPQSALFHDVPWSTDEVLRTTLEKAYAIGLSVELLPKVWDVDDSIDYRRWIKLQENLGDSCD